MAVFSVSASAIPLELLETPTPTPPADFKSTMSDTEPPPTGPPLAVILVSAIVGGLVLLVLILASLILLCFISKKNKREERKPDSENGVVKSNRRFRPDAKPLYAQVFRSSTMRSSSKRPKKPESTVKVTVVESSPKPPASTSDCNRPQPEEISAFGVDIPKTFRPFAPPPRNAGPIRREEEDHIYDRPAELQYDFLESTDGSGAGLTQSLQIPAAPAINPRMKPNGNPPPTKPRPQRGLPQSASVQGDSSSFTSSLNIHPFLQSIRPEFSESDHYQQPSSRPCTLPRGTKYPEDNNQIYSERLDPAMFSRGDRGSKKSIQALPYPPIYDRPRPVIPADQPTEVTRRNFVEIQDLGMGRFGRVVLGATTGLSLKDLKLGLNDDKCRSLLVAIKKLREDADTGLREAFQNEIKFMSKLKHANVARLLGVCSNGESFLMMEYMEKGDLHEFLQKQTLVSDSVAVLGEDEVTPLVLLYMGVQIASGMRYLANKKFVHRDLATRNCLVGRDFIVKISDFGMSRNLYDSSYYLIQGRLILPIRWMAYESFYGKFSTCSDAWSFGITLWEIYTLARLEPYGEMTDEEYISDTVKGIRRKTLQKPEACPKEIFDVMVRCWIHEPKMRADFEEIYSRLFLIYTKLSKLN